LRNKQARDMDPVSKALRNFFFFRSSIIYLNNAKAIFPPFLRPSLSSWLSVSVYICTYLNRNMFQFTRPGKLYIFKAIRANNLRGCVKRSFSLLLLLPYKSFIHICTLLCDKQFLLLLFVFISFRYFLFSNKAANFNKINNNYNLIQLYFSSSKYYYLHHYHHRHHTWLLLTVYFYARIKN
jgi:hypothetical protein